MTKSVFYNRILRSLTITVLCLVVVAVSIIHTPVAHAVDPVDAISYQGRLLNSNGVPVSDASLEMVFRFFDASSGGTCLWESDDGVTCDAVDETQTVALTDGLFSENIGSSVDPDGLSEAYPFEVSQIFGENADVYLEVVIAGETLSPRKQIVAAPYALNAQLIDGFDSTELLHTDGGIATGLYDFSGAVMSGASPFTFEGTTANDFETGFTFSDPTVDRTVTFQDASGIVAYLSDIPAGSSLWETSAFSTYEDDDDVIIGTSEDETISPAGFTLSGNDLFVAGDAGVEGNIFADGDLTIGGGNMNFEQATMIGDGGDTLILNAAGNIFIDDSNITGTGSLSISSATNLGLSLDAPGGAGIISVGSVNDATTVLIASGTGADTILIGSSDITPDTITIGSATDIFGIDSAEFDVSSANGSITINDGGDTGSIDVEGTIFNQGNLVFLGAGTVLSGAATTLTLNSGTTGTINIGDDASGESINIGTGAGAKAIGLGSTNTTSQTTVQSGTTGTLLTSTGDTTINGDNLFVTATDAILIDGAEFDVSQFTGSITIDDDGNAGLISIDGTVLNRSSLTFFTAGSIRSSASNSILISADSGNAAGETVAIEGINAQLTPSGSLTLSPSVAVATAITLTDTDFTNALSIGDNIIFGTSAGIDFTEFDVTPGSGSVTINDDADLGQLSVEGTILAQSVLQFFANANIQSASGNSISINADGGNLDGETVALTGTNVQLTGAGALTLSPGAAVATAITLTDTDFTNALSIGDNNIFGTTAAIDFTEFDVSSGTGSVTINDGGDAGILSVEGTTLSINTLSFTGAGTISSTGAGNDVTLSPADQIILNGGTTVDIQDNILNSVGNVTITDNLSPDSDNTRTLGTATIGWASIFIDNGDDSTIVSLGGDGLAETSSGASGVGVFDEFGNSTGGNVQDALDDLDAAIATGGAGAMWTLSGGVIRPTDATNDFAVGGTTAAASPFGVDESANTVFIGEGSGSNGILVMKASDADTANIIYSTNDRFEFTGGDVFIGSSSLGSVKADFVPNGDDLYVAGDIAAQTNMYANTFVAGDASTTLADGSLTTTGATDFALTIAGGDLTFAQNTTIGDGGDTLVLDTSDWDISTTGQMTGIASVITDDNQTTLPISIGVTGTDAGLHTISFQIDGSVGMTITATGNGAGGVGARTITAGVSSAADIIALGDADADISMTDAQWSISGAGVSAMQSVTVAAGGAGLDVASAGALGIGNTTATSLGMCNSAACDTITLGTNADADTITIGDTANDTTALNGTTVAISTSDWNIGTTGNMNGIGTLDMNGLLTAILGASISGATINLNAASNFATNINTGSSSGTISVGGGSGLVGIDSSDWDISNVGALSGIASIAGDTNQTLLTTNIDVTTPDAGAHTLSLQIDGNTGLSIAATGDGAGGVGVRTITIASSTAADIVTIGDANADISLTDAQWSVSAAGAGSFATLSSGATTLSGALDMSNNIITNIGDASTDFVAGGGLTLAGTLTANGALAANGTVTLGDNGDTIAIDSSDWDISTVGGMSGINSLGADNNATTLGFTINVTGTDATTHTLSLGIDGTPILTVAGTGNGGGGIGVQTVAMGAGAGADIVTIGDGNADITITDAQWNIAAAGTANFVSVGAATAGTGAFTTLSESTSFTANGASTFNTDADFVMDGTENVSINNGTGTGSNGVDLLTMNIINTDAGALIQRGIQISNLITSTSATEAFISLDNADTLTMTDGIIVIGSGGAITDGIDVSNANIVNAVNVGDNIILGTTAAITFTEFSVSAATGSVTINDGGDAGVLSVEGTTLNITDLTFVGAGTVASGGVGSLFMNSASGEVSTGPGDSLMIPAPPTTVNDALSDSPILTLRGTFDSQVGAGITSTARDLVFIHNITSGLGAPAGQLEINLAGGSTEFLVTDIGDIKALGGVAFGDTTGADVFDFVTANVSTADAISLTADSLTTVDGFQLSLDALTSGRGIFLERADGAGNFSGAGLLAVNMLDTTSTGNAGTFTSSGTGSALFLDKNGNTGSVVNTTTGGALHIDNTGNTDYGMTVYSDNAITVNSLAYVFNDNPGFDNFVMEIRSDATDAGSANGSALRILQNEVDAVVGNSTGTQALIIDTNTDCGAGDGVQDDGAIIKVREDVSVTPDTVFRFECDGDLFADGTLGTAAADVAEYYPSTDTLFPGELVSFDPASSGVLRSTTPYQPTLTGAISTVPGVLLGSETSGYRVALSGRIPVFVSTENGSISPGDPITSSTAPGIGMKATEAGTVIGFALDGFSGSGTGSISVFINPYFYAGSVISTDGSATLINDQTMLTSTGTASATSNGFASNTLSLRGSGWDGSNASNVKMSLVTDVTDASDYQLSIQNTTGTSVAYVSDDGDLALAGRLYPSDRGTLQTDKYIYYDGSSGLGGDFMRTNASGWATGSYDFAEMFPSTVPLTAGDVVVFGTDNESVTRSSTTQSTMLAGIVSTRPGFLAGENKDGQYPIALAGRVPTKISLENGEIAIGDALTSSSTPGLAMKATKAGMIVGFALEPFGTTTGGRSTAQRLEAVRRPNDWRPFDGPTTPETIITFVNVSYWNGGETPALPGTDNRASTIVITKNANNLSALNMNGNIYMSGNDILGVRRIAGLSDRWSLEEDGTIVSESVIKTVIESYQGERVETTAVTSPDVQITLVGTGTLKDGEAIIRFEDVSPSFNDVTGTTSPIRVIVTPNGPVSLYVYEKNNDGFGVKQINGSDSDVTFDWMVSAFRKDYEPVEVGETTTESPTSSGNTFILTEPSSGELVKSVEVPSETTDPASPSSTDIPTDDSMESTTVDQEPAPQTE